MKLLCHMQAIIYEPRPNAKRIKFQVPFAAQKWRSRIKEMPSSFFHYQQKLWSIVNTPENMQALISLFGANHDLRKLDSVVAMPHVTLNERAQIALAKYEEKIILKSYSQHTLRNYRQAIIRFFTYFSDRDLSQVSKEEIEGFVYHLKSKYKISDSMQNTVINAIKFYYEQLLGKKREYYDIQRPKKAMSLPNVLSLAEVKKLINTPLNLKHKAILYNIYSAGLRLGELIRLRVEDIHSDEGYIFLKAAKGKKDRRTVLSPLLLELLR
jgi:integrase